MPDPDDPQLDPQAAAVYVRLKDDFSLTVLWQTACWLMSSPRKVRAFWRIYRQGDAKAREMLAPKPAPPDPPNVMRMPWWNGPLVRSEDARCPQCPNSAPVGASTQATQTGGHTKSLASRLASWGVAAAVVAISIAGLYFALSNSSSEIAGDRPSIETSSDLIATAPDSLPQTKWLSDGTGVTLEAGTALRVGYTDELREVHLLEGKATFDVAQDTKKPKRRFVVKTHLGQVTAVGTKFVVGLSNTFGMEVQVHEGEVEISRVSASGSVIRLKGGQPPVRVPMQGLKAEAPNHTDGSGVVVPNG